MAKPKHYSWFKFDWDAYQQDSKRRRCSLETRGFWDELFVEMEKTDTYFIEGTIQEIANTAVCSTAQARRCIGELERTNAATIIKNQDLVKVISRRLLKRHNLREYNRLKQQEHRDKERVKRLSIAPSKNKSIREERGEEKKEELRGETASPRAPEPNTKPTDQRKVHPAIIGIWKVTGKYPPKELWDEIIDTMGDEIDETALKKCWVKWRVKGFKPTNFAWALEWYRDGIPTENGNGTNRQHNSNNPNKPTSASRLRDTADVLSQYPTEAELRDRKGTG